MVVCRYFVQGNCRYGSNCRFEHSYREYDSEVSGTNYRRTHGGQYNESSVKYSSGPQTSGNINVRDLMQTVITELSLSEKGGQWPLSCFAPFKEGVCYPGLVDYSPEEIRWQMYEAVKSGTVEDCKRRIQQLHESYKAKKHLIFNPNAETYATVEKLFKGEIPSANVVQNAPPANFSFNTAQHGKTSTPNLFGGSTSFVSGNITTPNLFGGAGDGLHLLSAVAAQSVPTENIFGKSQNLATSNVYSSQGAIPANAPSITTGLSNNSFFMKPQQTPFTNPVLQPSPDLQQKAAHTAVIHITASSQGDGVYTPLGELSDSERNSYSAQTFTIGHIPLRPPPKELCI